MLTIFACPKPFRDPHIAMIQRNAIRSWTLLTPTPEIVLFGDEEGLEQAARELGVAHRRDIPRNANGVPLLNGVFHAAEAHAASHVLAYVNADIVLMNDFMEAVTGVCRSARPFMMGGRPWDVAITSPLSFDSGWEDWLREQVQARGRLRGMNACDYFVFPRGFWGEIPPLTLGRPYFDNYLMYRCRRAGGRLIDATRGVMAVHQSHPYHAGASDSAHMDTQEAAENYRLAGGRRGLCSWWHATHRWTARGLQSDWRGRLRFWYPDALLGTPWHRKEFENGPR